MAEGPREFGSFHNIGGEFPHRSIFRGDFESQHGGTVSWAALQKFKKFLMDEILSYGGTKLPEGQWHTALQNYVNRRLAILDHEVTRFTWQTSWYIKNKTDLPETYGFLSGELSGKSITWQADVDSASYQITACGRSWPPSANNLNLSTDPHSGGANAGGDRPMTASNGVYFISPWIPTYGSPYNFDRLGEFDEFSLYMPDYDSLACGDRIERPAPDIDPANPPPPPDDKVYVKTVITPGSGAGLANDLRVHVSQLTDLKYDYSNMDETLTKNWLFLKINLEYFNEVYVDNILVDAYHICNLDNPAYMGGGSPTGGGGKLSESQPDFKVRDRWVGRVVHTIDESDEMRPSKQVMQQTGSAFGFGATRPIEPDYGYDERLLIHSNAPHGSDDPKIIAGNPFTFAGDKPLQINYQATTPVTITPMRVKLCSVKPVRNSLVLYLDSMAYDTPAKVDEMREKILRVMSDKRLKLYDDSVTDPTKAKITEYNQIVEGIVNKNGNM